MASSELLCLASPAAPHLLSLGLPVAVVEWSHKKKEKEIEGREPN
jgi:hypothetical protein